jgi:CRISPR-associated endonuclease/helicase Cas3
MPPKPFKLRPFQQRVFDAVIAGKSVILQAPTGAGKTRAALTPFLDNLAKSLSNSDMQPVLPLTCRYAVPLRVLARQFFNEYETAGQKIDRHLATHLTRTYQQFGQEAVRLQTGEQQEDPQFESALTFCTIDQLLASALAIPYGLGRRSANMNVGAILNSYLVFDEFHLYPLASGRSAWGARTTTLA